MYENAVLRENCPDPAIVAWDGAYWVVASTNDNRVPDKFPIVRSADLVDWEVAGWIFPRGSVPAWAVEDFWAPEVHVIEGRLVAYFTARHRNGRLCIGAATADTMRGPWRDRGSPLVSDDRVGMIDAHHFQDDDGRRYLYVKSDGNGLEPPEPSTIWVQRLAADGLALEGPRTVVLTNDQPWEGGVVEGPWVVRRDGRYYMFYSGEAFNSDRYATGVARASSPLGPFEKHDGPVLVSNARWAGPGHGSVIRVRERDWFVYHAWESGRIDAKWNEPVHPRMLLVDAIGWHDGWPRIHDGTPSTGRMPAP